MYHLTTLLVGILTSVFGPRVLAQSAPQNVILSYTAAYNDKTLSLNNVQCSNGPNGLETKGYATLGSLPNYPNVGAFHTVTVWDSPECGSCYDVTYNGKHLNILLVDGSEGSDLVVPLAAMEELVGDQAESMGIAQVSFTKTSQSACGL